MIPKETGINIMLFRRPRRFLQTYLGNCPLFTLTARAQRIFYLVRSAGNGDSKCQSRLNSKQKIEVMEGNEGAKKSHPQALCRRC
jgi:hypothetical protein